MKKAILRGPRDLVIEDQPLDTDHLGPHQIWIRTEISGLKIGTDRGNYEGAESMPGAPNEFPRGVGDSNVGIVQGVGSEVTSVAVGDRVHTRAQHQSEYLYADDQQLVKVPDGVALEDAVWGHLYTLSSLCYRKAMFLPGEYVAVVGLGVLGLGAVALGPVFGARVIGLGNSQTRLEMAERVGAEATYLSDDPQLAAKLDAHTGGSGVDLVILTANPWPAYRTACEVVRDGGRVSIVSLLGRGEPPLDFNPLYTGLFYDKGIHLIAVNGKAGQLYPSPHHEVPTWNQWCAHLLELMARGLLAPSRLVTHRLPYAQMQDAYEMAAHRDKSMLLVTFDWSDASS